MPGRDAEAAARSKRVGEAVRAEMRKQNVTSVELRTRIESARGKPVSDSPRARDVWTSRRLAGDINLVKPVSIVYGPTEDLEAIAAALGVKVDKFVRAARTGTRKPDDK